MDVPRRVGRAEFSALGPFPCGCAQPGAAEWFAAHPSGPSARRAGRGRGGGPRWRRPSSRPRTPTGLARSRLVRLRASRLACGGHVRAVLLRGRPRLPGASELLRWPGTHAYPQDLLRLRGPVRLPAGWPCPALETKRTRAALQDRGRTVGPPAAPGSRCRRKRETAPRGARRGPRGQGPAGDASVVPSAGGGGPAVRPAPRLARWGLGERAADGGDGGRGEPHALRRPGRSRAHPRLPRPPRRARRPAAVASGRRGRRAGGAAGRGLTAAHDGRSPDERRPSVAIRRRRPGAAASGRTGR